MMWEYETVIDKHCEYRVFRPGDCRVAQWGPAAGVWPAGLGWRGDYLRNGHVCWEGGILDHDPGSDQAREG